MDLHILKDYFGMLAPYFLILLTIFLLRNMKTYLQFFVYGIILNNILIVILKLAIKEPRPNTEEKAIEIGVINGARISFDKFGMPSGHAQNCSFCLAYITMVLNDPFVTGLYTIITLNSLFQRYLYNNHTILQLIVGIIIGTTFGYLMYVVANKNIMGNIKMKKDDNGPL